MLVDYCLAGLTEYIQSTIDGALRRRTARARAESFLRLSPAVSQSPEKFCPGSVSNLVPCDSKTNVFTTAPRILRLARLQEEELLQATIPRWRAARTRSQSGHTSATRLFSAYVALLPPPPPSIFRPRHFSTQRRQKVRPDQESNPRLMDGKRTPYHYANPRV